MVTCGYLSVRCIGYKRIETNEELNRIILTKLITEAFTEMRITRGGKVINFDVFKKVDVGVSVSWMSTFRFDFLKRFNTS